MFVHNTCIGAKVVGGLVAVPVICGVGIAALTVAAPVYGVYRLVRHVRRRQDSPFHDYDLSFEDIYYADVRRRREFPVRNHDFANDDVSIGVTRWGNYAD